MKDVLATLEAWLAEGQEVARAVVVRTYGSAPRREGATMLLAADGRVAGSVSGGCVEGATAGHLAEALTSGRQRLVRFGVTDEQAWSVGLACGGVIDVLIQPHVPEAVLEAARAAWARAAWSPGATGHGAGAGVRGAHGTGVAAATGVRGANGTGVAAATGHHVGAVVVATLPAGAPGDEPGASLVGPAVPPEAGVVVAADGSLASTLGSADDDAALAAAALMALDAGVSATREVAGAPRFLEVFAVPPRLVIVGGVPIAMALVHLARELGFETIVIDARAAFATPERFPDVDRLLVAWPDEAAEEIGLGPADAIVVLSHDPKFDEPAIAEALRRGCRYVGAIGSRRTQHARRERLRAEGLAEVELARLHAPIGLDLGGRETAEVALAILAEVVAERHGASARPMREKGGG